MPIRTIIRTILGVVCACNRADPIRTNTEKRSQGVVQGRILTASLCPICYDVSMENLIRHGDLEIVSNGSVATVDVVMPDRTERIGSIDLVSGRITPAANVSDLGLKLMLKVCGISVLDIIQCLNNPDLKEH